MDIKIKCRACDRDFPLSLAMDEDSQKGHCPFCGEALTPQYTSTFLDAAERVLALAPEFEKHLTLFAEMAGSFEIIADSVVKPVADAVAVQDRAVNEPYRGTWPPAPAEPVS